MAAARKKRGAAADAPTVTKKKHDPRDPELLPGIRQSDVRANPHLFPHFPDHLKR